MYEVSVRIPVIIFHSIELNLSYTEIYETFNCEICNATFEGKNLLALHKYTVHKIGKPQKKKCEICFRVFKNELAYKSHSKVHNKELIGENPKKRIRKWTNETCISKNEAILLDDKKKLRNREIVKSELGLAKIENISCPECNLEFHGIELLQGIY